MRIGEYNQLAIHQKAMVLGSTSVFLTCNFDDEYRSSLYASKNFYIEVIWDRDTNGLIEIIAFKDGSRLDKYLQKISLHDLI